MVQNHSVFSRLGEASLIGILCVIALSCLFPVWHTVAISFSDKSAAAAGIVTVWPIDFTVAAYYEIIADANFIRSILISVERVLLGGGINFLLTVLAAYPLSKQTSEFRSRNWYMWFLVFTMLFSGGIIPLYILVKTLGLFNSIWALVLPGAVPVYSVILVLNYFRSLPKEMTEAGYMDGAGPWYMLFKIYVPLSAPVLATVTLFSVVGHWNAFFDGLIFMRSQENYPLQTYIQQMVVQFHASEQMDSSKAELLSKLSNQTLNAAKLVVSMTPVLVVYPFLQRYFIQGIMLGSVKE